MSYDGDKSRFHKWWLSTGFAIDYISMVHSSDSAVWDSPLFVLLFGGKEWTYKGKGKEKHNKLGEYFMLLVGKEALPCNRISRCLRSHLPRFSTVREAPKLLTRMISNETGSCQWPFPNHFNVNPMVTLISVMIDFVYAWETNGGKNVRNIFN